MPRTKEIDNLKVTLVTSSTVQSTNGESSPRAQH